MQGQEATLTLPQGVTSKTGNTVTTNAAGKVVVGCTTVAGEHSITASSIMLQKTVTVKLRRISVPVRRPWRLMADAPKVANDDECITLTATVAGSIRRPLFLALWSSLICLRAIKPLADGNIMVNADKEGKAELKVVSVTAGTYEITASAGNDQPSNAQSVTFCGR
ncbi:hypothetical protein ACLB1N_16805 [Escherichia coli]